MLLSIRKVSKKFGGLWALREVDLEVDEGEILGVIGPNGAGKTTLFNCITGYYKPDGGKIIFRSLDITGKPPYKISKLGIARTFQLTKAFNNLTVFDNIRIASIVSGSVGEINKVLEVTGLHDKRDVLACNLTLIERKKLELARALSLKPKLLLLDEVMAGLKPHEADELLKVIKEVNDSGVAVVVVEHVIRTVLKLCRRVAVLDYGVKIAEGSPEEIARNERVIKAYLGEEFVA
ncbi:MAG: ATP-binding cassette domain-containing protein [Sulfolobales archaeon]